MNVSHLSKKQRRAGLGDVPFTILDSLSGRAAKEQDNIMYEILRP
jgi:hypothetical protein